MQPALVNRQKLATDKGNTPPNGVDMLELDRFFEDADDDPISAEGASRGVFFDRYRELSSIAMRLDQIEAEHGAVEARPNEFDELWRRRLALVRDIVETPATKVRDTIFKMSLLSSFLADGELRLALTCQCVQDCDQALVVEDETERDLKALEPGLWVACERVREDLAVAPTDGMAIPESWWRDLRDSVWAIARHQALTSVGLKAKGKIFQEVWCLANETDGLGALQMSYMRDFRALASAHLRKECDPICQAG
jgi:hypothetical protein